MPKISYRNYRPSADSQALIDLCNDILDDYTSQGYELTLRQLYYQLVSRDCIPNTMASYNNLGAIVSRAREAGMIDWGHIEDRTRNVRSNPHWQDKQDFLQSVAPQFKLDLWDGQPVRCFVFVEKEALEQVVGMAADRWDVPYFANKGYLSSSAAWDVAHNRMLLADDACEQYVVLHFGDHDPSGIDMTRDIRERLNQFARPYRDEHAFIDVSVKRIALNMDQVEQYGPPPNPAKVTDSRFAAYQSQHGDESWELDALEPSVIQALVSDNIKRCLLNPILLESKRRLQAEIIEEVKALASR